MRDSTRALTSPNNVHHSVNLSNTNAITTLRLTSQCVGTFKFVLVSVAVNALPNDNIYTRMPVKPGISKWCSRKTQKLLASLVDDIMKFNHLLYMFIIYCHHTRINIKTESKHNYILLHGSESSFLF